MPAAFLSSVSLGLNLWQWIAAGNSRLHKRKSARSSQTAVTLFKPLKGADEGISSCLESWFSQDYAGDIQLLFGVADPNDPVCGVVRELIRQYPKRDAELVICQPLLGANAKVSTLAHLEPKAKHGIWIISDADVLAPAHLIREVVYDLEDKEASLVSCFYKLNTPETFGSLWESVAVNSDFWSQVRQGATTFEINFALGAVMAAQRAAIKEIGGFRPLLNQLADDYELGRRIAKSGGEVDVSDIVVECKEPQKSFAEAWQHQLRWARTIRVCQPAPYFFSILSNLTLFALIAWLCGESVVFLSTPYTPFEYFALLCGFRILTAAHNQYRLTKRFDRCVEAIFAPVKDLLSFVIWVCAFTGSTVTWRGETFLVKRGGELVKPSPER